MDPGWPAERKVANHQRRALARLDSWWKSRAEAKKHGFIAMPTGSGKTFTAVTFAVDSILAPRKHPSVVWVAHSEFLLNQAEQEFERQLREKGLSGIIDVARASSDGRGVEANVILAMLQTLARGTAVTKIKRAGGIDVVIFDEFHRLAAPTWREVPQKFQRSGVRTLGLSATPFRKTPEKTELLRKVLPHRIYSVGMSELVRDRFLADPTVVRVEVANKRPIRLNDAERKHFQQFKTLKTSTLERVADQLGRDQLIVETYKQGASRFQSTIVFCCTVDHAAHLAEQFRRKGIAAESICGSGKDPINREKLDGFRRREFPIATSVALLTEGVDVPACRTVFLARPVESPNLVIQMIGRAMRGERSGGAKACTIVDFVDTIEGLDLSASHFGFVRDHDEKVRHLVRRRPSPHASGISVALLLRLREFLHDAILRAGGATNAKDILVNELLGWLEYWDGEIHRVLLVPREKGHAIHEALLRTRDGGGPDGADAAERARSAYDDEALDEDGVSEEDFVSIASATGNDIDNLQFHRLRGQRKSAGRVEAVGVVSEELKRAGVDAEFRDPLDALRAALDHDGN